MRRAWALVAVGVALVGVALGTIHLTRALEPAPPTQRALELLDEFPEGHWRSLDPQVWELAWPA